MQGQYLSRKSKWKVRKNYKLILQRIMVILGFCVFFYVTIHFVKAVYNNRKVFGAMKEEIAKTEYDETSSCRTEFEKKLLEQREDGYYVNVDGKVKIPLELYIFKTLSDTINVDYDLEVLKAQAIILRSNLISQADNKKEINGIDESFEKNDRFTEKNMQNENKIRMAVLKSWGIVMVYSSGTKKDIARTSYHAMSNGNTRCEKEGSRFKTGEKKGINFKLGEKEGSNYKSSEKEKGFKSVSCRENLEANDYISIHEITTQKTGKLGECIRDGQGYILWIRVDNKWISAEAFRKDLGLESADFEYVLKNKKYRFRVRGRGHGYGMDQYYGNVLAEEGKDAYEILQYFFDNISFCVF